MLFPTMLVGSYPQPEWLIDRKKLAGRFPPRVRALELWRVAPALLEEAQNDATLLAIRAQELAGLDVVTDGEIRRESYSNRFATALSGVDLDNPGVALDRSGHENPVPRIVGPVRRRRCPGARSVRRRGCRAVPSRPVPSRLDEALVRRLGPLIEHHPAFPNRTNVQFARVVSRDQIDILIWERGAGWTLASGSSSSAVACAAVKNGHCDHGRVTVRMPGGTLQIDVRPDWSVRLQGPVEEVYTGTLSRDLMDALAR